MTLGMAAVVEGHRDEDRVARALEARGWLVSLYGLRTWDDGGAMAELIRAHCPRLRHAPDLLAGHPRLGMVWVEVVNTHHVDLCLEVAKLEADGWWDAIAPVWVVDCSTTDAWRWRCDWPELATSDVQRWGIGSGDAYIYLRREGHVPFNEAFGEPTP